MNILKQFGDWEFDLKEDVKNKMKVLLIILFLIIFALLIYIFSIQYALWRLKKNIEQKKRTNSNVRLMNPSSFKILENLVDEYNYLFDQIKENQLDYQRNRFILEQTLHNISHDIRTPLTVASGYVQILKKEQSVQPQLLKIEIALKTISKRLEELLLYQNLLEQNIRVEWEKVDISNLLKEQLLSMYDVFTERKFQVKLEIEETVLLELDPDIMQRILTNILGNVLKHGEKLLEIQLTRQPKLIQLRIRNASNQEIQNLEQLTNRFYLEDLSTSEKSSGLGLYIAKELVELTGGILKLTYQNNLFEVLIQWPSK